MDYFGFGVFVSIGSLVSILSSIYVLCALASFPRREKRRLFARLVWHISVLDLLCACFNIPQYIMALVPHLQAAFASNEVVGSAVCSLTILIKFQACCSSFIVAAIFAVSQTCSHFGRKRMLRIFHHLAVFAWPLGSLVAAAIFYESGSYEFRSITDDEENFGCQHVDETPMRTYLCFCLFIWVTCCACYLASAIKLSGSAAPAQLIAWRHLRLYPVAALVSFGPYLYVKLADIISPENKHQSPLTDGISYTMLALGGFFNAICFVLQSKFLRRRSMTADVTGSFSPGVISLTETFDVTLPVSMRSAEVTPRSMLSTSSSSLSVLFETTLGEEAQEEEEDGADLPNRQRAAYAIADRNDPQARLMRDAMDRGLLASRTVADFTPRHRVQGTVDSMRCDVQRGFRRKVLALVVLSFTSIMVLMGVVEYYGTYYMDLPVLLHLPMLYATVIVMVVLVQVRHQVPFNYIGLLMFTVCWSCVLSAMDADLSSVPGLGAYQTSARPCLRLIVLLSAGLACLTVLSQVTAASSTHLLSLRAGGALSAALVIGTSLIVHFMNFIAKGDHDWLWINGVHLTAAIVLLWAGHDLQHLVQRLNPDEYIYALVQFYADVGVAVIVCVVLLFVIPLIIFSGGDCALCCNMEICDCSIFALWVQPEDVAVTLDAREDP